MTLLDTMSRSLQLNMELSTSGQSVQKSHGVLKIGNIQSSFFIENFRKERGKFKMAFFTTAITGLKVVVTAIGGGVGVWGVINLLEGYGNDNPGAKSQGMKQLMAGAGIVIIAQTVIPQLTTLFA